MTQAERVLSTPPTNTSALTPSSPNGPFYGAQCASYPRCGGGCGIGCTKEHAPRDTTRRGFLGGTAAALAAGTAVNVAALATIRPAAASAADPVFDLIAAHTKVWERVSGAEAANLEGRPIVSEDEFNDLATAEMDLFLGLLEAVPTTLAGVVALVNHMNQIRERDPWKFEDNYATPLIGTLADAFSRIFS